MNKFSRVIGTVVSASPKVIDGAVVITIAVKNSIDVNSGLPLVVNDSFSRPVANIEKLIGYRWDGILTQGLIGAKVEYDYSLVKAGEEFVLYEGSDTVQVADATRPIHNLRSIEMDFNKMDLISRRCSAYVAIDADAVDGTNPFEAIEPAE